MKILVLIMVNRSVNKSLKTYDKIDKEGPLGRRMTLWKWPLYTNQDKIPDLVSFEYNDPRQELIVI